MANYKRFLKGFAAFEPKYSKYSMREFLSDQRGLSAVMVGMGLIPIMLSIGMAFDVTKSHLLKSELGAAVDAAALAGGRVFFSDHRDQDVVNYFEANFPPGYLDSTVTGPVIAANETAGSLQVSATATMPTTFMRLVGVDTVTVSASGTSTRRSVPIDVVLAIDISGSMLSDVPGESISRINAAKKAAKKLVDIIYGDPPSTLVRVGVVPWAGKVNVTNQGTTYGEDAGGSPLTFPSLSSYGGDGMAWKAVGLSSAAGNPYDQDSYTYSYDLAADYWAPSDSYNDEGPTPSGAPSTAHERFVLNSDSHRSSYYYQNPLTKLYYAHNSDVPLLAPPPPGWSGCVYARYSFNGHMAQYNDSTPSGLNSSSDLNSAADHIDGPIENYGPSYKDWIGWMPMGSEGDPQYGGYCDLSIAMRHGHECTPCPVSGITKLENGKANVIDAIDNVNALSGSYTNIPQGLAWAWRVISPGVPFTESATNPLGATASNRTRAIVLLSDGTNTTRAGDAYNRSLSYTSMREDRLREVAENVKNDDVLIYTIQFAVNSSSQEQLMKDVATEPGEPFYFYAPSSDELDRIFQAVATNLAELRLSK
ncbi:MAG: VWA domain-containing protein [Sphingomonadales bacterium]